jgi:Predicted oxidoreductases (related to aryl-alcohol dehydrogenases)
MEFTRRSGKMRYTAIPNTDLVLSVLSLGTGGAGATYDRAATFAMLDAFFEQGGNFVDTAHVYNDWIPGERSRSEKLLGAWMQERRNRSHVLLATKGSHPDLAQMQVGRLSPAEICADLEESLLFLQVGTIDLYWLHRDDPTRPAEEIIDTLEAQVRAGKIRYFGCSNWRLDRIQAARQYAAAQGITGFVGVQNLWSLAKPNLDAIRRRDPTHAVMDDDLWQYHKQTGLAAIPYTSQANGLFQKMDNGARAATLSTDLARLYLSSETEARYQRLKILSQQTGLSTTQIGLGFLTSQPFATCPVIGPQSLAQLRDCLAAADVLLTPEQVSFLAPAA